MDAVIDTNVLISGLLFAESPPGEILDLVFRNDLEPVFDDRILYEYREVLRRPKFSFPESVIEDLLLSLIRVGRAVIPVHSRLKLPDEKDRCFYECATATLSKLLITGNKKHFPTQRCPGIIIFTPKEFLDTF
jgi:uncharacterized protein